MYRGWIETVDEEEKIHLEYLDVIIQSNYDEEKNCYPDCLVDETAFVKLDPFWGRYIWGFSCIGN